MIIPKDFPKKAAIYKLICETNGKIYIGKTNDLRTRLYQHRLSIKQTMRGSLLQKAIIKYGWESFTIQILKIFETYDKIKDNQLLLKIETNYIKEYNSTNPEIGYNLCEISTDRSGLKTSEETKEKIRQSRIGKKASVETREKLRLANIGKKLSEETKEKMRRKKLSEETKEKIRISNTGRKMSPEAKQKLSLARTGMKFSDEHKNNLRKCKIGRRLSEETRLKLSQSRIGKKHTEETKEKIKKSKKK